MLYALYVLLGILICLKLYRWSYGIRLNIGTKSLSRLPGLPMTPIIIISVFVFNFSFARNGDIRWYVMLLVALCDSAIAAGYFAPEIRPQLSKKVLARVWS